MTAVQTQASWAYSLDVNFLAAGYNNPGGGSAGSGIYAGKEGPLVITMPNTSTIELLMATVPKKSSVRTNPGLNDVPNFGELITPTSYRNMSSKGFDDNNSGIQMLRDNLGPYETVLLTEGEFFSERTLCHNELCCDFQVAMHNSHGGLNSSDKGYVYRLAVFDGIRSYTYVTAGVQVCAVMFCTDSSVSSCGYEFETQELETFHTVFDYVHISGNFRLNNSIQLPNTLIQGYGVLPADRFQFTKKEIPEKNEVQVDMKTTSQNTELLTFAIFGRDFQKDGGLLTLPSVGQRINVAEVLVLLSVTVFLFLHAYF